MLKIHFVYIFLWTLWFCYSVTALASQMGAESIKKKSRAECTLPENILKIGLTKDQGKAICKAAKGYDIDLFWEGEKILVLVGERHHTPMELVEQGQDLLNQFPFRGIEGFPSPQYHDEVLKSIQEIKDQNSLSSRFLGALDWGLTKLIQQSDSLIRRAKMDSVYMFFDGQADYLRVRGGQAQAYSRKNFSIESFDQARSLPLSVNLESDPEVIQEVWFHCAEGFKNKKSIQKLCPDKYLVEGRNRGMLSGLSLALNEFSEMKSILILVGAKHMEGLRKELVCKWGFDFRPVTRGINHSEGKGFDLTPNSVNDIRVLCSEFGNVSSDSSP